MTLPIAVSLGDPAGIGPEVTAKAWALRKEHNLPVFFGVGDVRSVEAVWKGPIERITDPSHAPAVFGHAFPVIQVEDAGPIIPGVPNPEGARCSLDALEMAVGLTRSNTVSALVTAPICKSELYDIGFTHPGQTEFVAERCGISPENAEEIGMVEKLRLPLEFATASRGHFLKIDNTVRSDFFYEDVRMSDEFMIVPDLSEEAIIGVNTMQKWRIKLDFEHDRVEVDPRMAKMQIIQIK